jgi:hypothetical protein
MNRIHAAVVAAAIVMSVTAAAASANYFSGWSTAHKIDEIAGNHGDLNTASQDGCPIQSPDGRSLYIASNRPGGKGGLDIWVASRATKSDPGARRRISRSRSTRRRTTSPTPLHGGRLLFVSRRVDAGVTCGQGDIYFARESPAPSSTTPARCCRSERHVAGLVADVEIARVARKQGRP